MRAMQGGRRFLYSYPTPVMPESSLFHNYRTDQNLDNVSFKADYTKTNCLPSARSTCYPSPYPQFCLPFVRPEQGLPLQSAAL